MHEPVGRPRALVTVLVACAVVVSVMQTLVVPLLHDLPHLLHAAPADTSWVITVTLLTGALANPVAGRLGDMYGRRRLLLASLLLLSCGSVVCALADSLAPMIAGRALQGAAFGVVSLSIGIAREELPAAALGSAVGMISAASGAGYAFGLPVAAFVVQTANHHVMFWVTAGLGLLCAAAVTRVVPARPGRRSGGFDGLGAAGLCAGLGSLLLVVSKGRDWGWTSPTVAGLGTGGVLVLGLWAVWELRTREPLVDLRRASGRRLLTINAATLVVGFGMYVQSLVWPQILQMPEATGYGMGLSLAVSGLVLMPAGVATMTAASLSSRLSRAHGPRTSLVAGAGLLCVAYAAAPWLLGRPWHVLTATCVISFAIGLAVAAMPALVIAAVPAEDTAAATGLNSLMRSTGTAIGAAITGAVLANGTRDFPGGPSAPTQSAFVTVLSIGLAGCAAGLVLALVIPRRDRHRTPAKVDSRPESAPSGKHTPLADQAP